MDHFNYQDNTLFAEDNKITDIIAKIGTPFYCYSLATLTRHFKVFEDSLSELENKIICYAVKANSNITILSELAKLGSGADVVSAGEIKRVLMAGITPDKIVFSGVGKTAAEIEFALSENILQFNVESEPELDLINNIASKMDKIANIAIRINPDVDAKTHEKISTGKKENKFGIDIENAMSMFEYANKLPHINLQGVSVHIGSQLTKLEPFKQAYMVTLDFIKELLIRNIKLKTIDLGGGLGIPYSGESPPTPNDYGNIVSEIFGDFVRNNNIKLIFEPGRLIMGNAGILVSEVIYVKKSPSRNFVITDAAMNDLLRPSLYDAWHDIIPINLEHNQHLQNNAISADENNPAKFTADIVGPVCETGDVFAKNRVFPQEIKQGDYLAIRSCGAYGAVMSSNYNSRPLLPEVLADGNNFRLIRKRQSFDDMIRLESQK